jgi:pimeloyl-ACP methyl ester carboxylesterase
VLPAAGTPRGAMFLVAGGPGQGSAHTFDLGTRANADLFRLIFPGYTLVAYDDRGTGGSGLLDCPALQAAPPWSPAGGALAGACATALGASRDFYGTGDHAEDLDAVRTALGLDRIGILGVSYGTKLALAYALAHPEHVDRLVLDSVVPPERSSPYSGETLQAMPATLAAYCADGACRAATPNFAGDVVALANALATKPIAGTVINPRGRARPQRMGALRFLGLVVDADINPGLAAVLPAAVHAARGGDPRPLLRVATLSNASSGPVVDLSAALYAATVCRDGGFPWTPETPSSARPALLRAAIAALPPGSLGPFGRWAADLGNASFCVGWPSPAGGVPIGAGPLPDVPVLVLSGGLDLRTPTAGGRSVAARFPQGHLVVVPGVGHSVLTADPSLCSIRVVRDWLDGKPVPESCPRAQPLLSPLAAFPRPGSVPANQVVGPRQTLDLVAKAVRDAEDVWLLTALAGRRTNVGGLYGGRLSEPSDRELDLRRYSIAPGIAVSGKLQLVAGQLPIGFTGQVAVDGASASPGSLTLSNERLAGVLGGTRLGATL